MVKVMNVVFGIGIAVLLFMVVMLGTQVFYPEPRYEDYCNATYYEKIPPSDISLCNVNMTFTECITVVKGSQTPSELQNQEMERCNREFNEVSEIYGKNLFVINNIAGIIAVIVSLFLLSMVNIAAGVSFSGLILIIYGFMRGWQGVGDKLKFAVALIVAAIFVYFAVRINKKYSQDSRKR